MRGLALTLAALALGACSEEPQPDAVKGDAPSAGTGAPSGAPSAQAPSARPSGGLTGQVSPLNSNVSGLNVRVTDMGTIIDLPTDALFAFDSADLNPDATKQLDASAQMIRAAPAGPIKIIGHTDSKGDDAYNQKLSEARAKAVAEWFGQQAGVRQRTFDVSGQGEKSPIAANETLTGKDDPEARARNRRVELILPK